MEYNKMENWKVIPMTKEEILEFKKNEELWIELCKENSKRDDIEKYKTLEQKAIDLRTKYLTAEKMPAWTLKEKKMAFILDEEKVVLEKYNAFILELKDKYGDQIEEELI